VTRPAWAVVPAKALDRGKSRLSTVLSRGERVRFARALVEHMLDALRESPCLDGILVATDGDDVADLARSCGAHVLRDRGHDPLSTVIDHALADVQARGARAAVVLMADLPRVESRDVDALLRALAEADVALVRDHLGRHTNALALSPPTAIATRFGREDSFAEHCAAARDAGLRVVVLDNERVAFDVDDPADHVLLTGGIPGAGT